MQAEFLCRAKVTRCMPPPPRSLHQQTGALFFLLECAGPEPLFSLQLASLSRERIGMFQEMRQNQNLFCCAVAAPHRRTLFRAVSCEACVLSRVLSVRLSVLENFASVGKTAACCQVWPQGRTLWPGTPFPWLFGPVPELLQGHSEKQLDRLYRPVHACSNPGLKPPRPLGARGGGWFSLWATQPRHVPCRVWGRRLCSFVVLQAWLGSGLQCSFLMCRSPEGQFFGPAKQLMALPLATIRITYPEKIDYSDR